MKMWYIGANAFWLFIRTYVCTRKTSGANPTTFEFTTTTPALYYARAFFQSVETILVFKYNFLLLYIKLVSVCLQGSIKSKKIDIYFNKCNIKSKTSIFYIESKLLYLPELCIFLVALNFQLTGF
jgi:hypothetical protein